MVPIKISSKLDGLVMKVGGKVKWQKVGFKFKKLRQGETVPLWDEPLPRARPDFPQRNTLFSFKMKLNIWEVLKDITRFPLFHPCHHVSSISYPTTTSVVPGRGFQGGLDARGDSHPPILPHRPPLWTPRFVSQGGFVGIAIIVAIVIAT